MHVSERITKFVARALALEHRDAEQVRRDYFHTHGSTLRGLMTHHATDPEDYLAYVHDIDLEMMQANPELDAALGRLNGRKVIDGDELKGVAAKGPIRIVPSGPVSLANVYVRPLAKR